MSIVVQILLGLIVTFLGFLIGRAWKISQRRRPYWSARRFWRPFLSGDVKIVMSKFNEFNEWEASGLVGVGGMEAAIGAVKLFDDLGLRSVGRKMDVVYHDRTDRHLYESNLVCIGGPDSNEVTKLILSRIDHTIMLGIPELHLISFIDTKTHKEYGPIPDPDSQEAVSVKFDHGVIVKAPSPFDRRRYILLLAGNYGYGVWAAIKLMSSPQFLHHPYVKNGLNIECLFRSEIVNGVPMEPEIIVVREVFPIRIEQNSADHF